jgi:hypothetical protein
MFSPLKWVSCCKASDNACAQLPLCEFQGTNLSAALERLPRKRPAHDAVSPERMPHGHFPLARRDNLSLDGANASSLVGSDTYTIYPESSGTICPPQAISNSKLMYLVSCS